MEIKVTSQNENKLLHRKEIGFTITGFESTPSKAEVHRELCKKLSLLPDSTIITNLKQEFGMKECSGTAHSYESKEQMGLEPEYSRKRMEKSLAAKKGAEPEAKEKAEEQPEKKPEEKAEKAEEKPAAGSKAE